MILDNRKQIRRDPKYYTTISEKLLIVHEFTLPNNMIIYHHNYTHGINILYHIFFNLSIEILTRKYRSSH